jgi:hypothetical protein
LLLTFLKYSTSVFACQGVLGIKKQAEQRDTVNLLPESCTKSAANEHASSKYLPIKEWQRSKN